jgi:hypothetical protein
MVLNIVFCMFLLIFLIPALRFQGGWAGFFSIMTGIFFLLLMVNWLRGPTCICHIMTPIQTVKLPALRRLKKTEKALARLRPLIEGSQGALSAESFRKVRQEELSPGIKRTPKALNHEQGNFHIILFFLLLISALFITIDIFYQSVATSLISTLIILSASILLIVSLVKQTGSDLNKPLKVITWITMGYFLIVYISSYAVFFYVTIKNLEIRNDQWELIKVSLSMSPMDYPWLMKLSIFCLSSSMIIGISGLVLTVRFRKEYEQQINPQSSGQDASLIELDYE